MQTSAIKFCGGSNGGNSLVHLINKNTYSFCIYKSTSALKHYIVQ